MISRYLLISSAIAAVLALFVWSTGGEGERNLLPPPKLTGFCMCRAEGDTSIPSVARSLLLLYH